MHSAEEDEGNNNGNVERHSYSCKRCRRLKKKCSRTKPECQNCGKAREKCEYVPRAPRRKKSEILRSMEMTETSPVQQRPLPPLTQHAHQTYHLQQAQLPSLSQLNFTRDDSRQVTAFSTFDKQRPQLPPLPSLPTRSEMQPPPTTITNGGGAQPHPVTSLHNQLLSIPQIIPGHSQTSNVTSPLSTITNDLLTRCVDRFFEDYAKTYPFLNHTTFCHTHNPLAHSFASGSHFDVNMTVLLGYVALSKVRKVPDDPVLRDALLSRAFDNAEIVSDESIEGIKKLLYYGMFTLMQKDGDTSWYVAGLIDRMVVALGLNEGKVGLDEDTKRVFWSCYNFDRVVSVALGRPAGLLDKNIDVPLLSPMGGEDEDLIKMLRAVSSLRRVEGMIMSDVHSPGALKTETGALRTAEDRSQVLQRLRMEIEAWYNNTSLLSCADRKVSLTSCTTSWYSAVYYTLLSLLYRPSFLVPSPPAETLQLLGKCTLQGASFQYNLHTLHQLPMHWVQLNRWLTHCTTLIYCICHTYVDVVDTKAEISFCMELLEYFAMEWSVAAELLDVFRKLNIVAYDLRVNQAEMAHGADTSAMFKKIGEEYCDVLIRNGYTMKFDQPVLKGIRGA